MTDGWMPKPGGRVIKDLYETVNFTISMLGEIDAVVQYRRHRFRPGHRWTAYGSAMGASIRSSTRGENQRKNRGARWLIIVHNAR